MARPSGGLIRFARRPAATDRSAEPPSPFEIMAAMATAVLVIDPEGIVVETNSACESLFNLSRNHIVGQAIFEAIGHPLTSMPSDAPFAAYDIEVTLPGHRRMRVDLMVAPLPDRFGWRAISIHAHARSALNAPANVRASGRKAGQVSVTLETQDVETNVQRSPRHG